MRPFSRAAPQVADGTGRKRINHKSHSHAEQLDAIPEPSTGAFNLFWDDSSRSFVSDITLNDASSNMVDESDGEVIQSNQTVTWRLYNDQSASKIELVPVLKREHDEI